jgi:hypothetical protein
LPLRVFAYTDSTNNLEYLIRFSDPISLTAAHFHHGEAGINGPVAAAISAGANKITQLSGNVALSAPDEALLLNGGLYVNFYTIALVDSQENPVVADISPVLTYMPACLD